MLVELPSLDTARPMTQKKIVPKNEKKCGFADIVHFFSKMHSVFNVFNAGFDSESRTKPRQIIMRRIKKRQVGAWGTKIKKPLRSVEILKYRAVLMEWKSQLKI